MFSGVCYSDLSKVCPFQNNVSCSIRYCFRSLFLKLKLFSKILFQRIFEDFSKHYSIIKVHVVLPRSRDDLFIISNFFPFVNNFFHFFQKTFWSRQLLISISAALSSQLAYNTKLFLLCQPFFYIFLYFFSMYQIYG